MSDDFSLAAPPFDPAHALLQLQRAMRDCKLAARGTGFELRGKAVVTLEIEGPAIAARVVRRLATTPEWDRYAVKNAADQRKLIDEVKKRLTRWTDED